ncbi:MAG TPA: hypothetical protein PK771_03310 [Spirochaetota bacterium]|nr:hypothetical protein [Spirochaetota bacterium]
MINIDTKSIEKDIKKIGKSVVSTVKKTLIGIFTFLTIAFSGISVMLFFLNIPISTAVGIFFAFLAAAFLIIDFAIFMSLKGSDDGGNYNYRKEIGACEKILNNLKKFINTQKNRDEYMVIYNQLVESLENAKLLSVKIDNIRTTLKGKDWNIQSINEQISNERTKSNPDTKLVTQLEEQRNNIGKLVEREQQLLNKLSLLKSNFSSIYTKITLLSTSDDEKSGFDEIETEIQKNLDFKLKVSKYEEELNKDIDL